MVNLGRYFCAMRLILQNVGRVLGFSVVLFLFSLNLLVFAGDRLMPNSKLSFGYFSSFDVPLVDRPLIAQEQENNRLIAQEQEGKRLIAQEQEGNHLADAKRYFAFTLLPQKPPPMLVQADFAAKSLNEEEPGNGMPDNGMPGLADSSAAQVDGTKSDNTFVSDKFYLSTPPSILPNAQELKIIYKQFYCFASVGLQAVDVDLAGTKYLWFTYFNQQTNMNAGCRWDDYGFNVNVFNGWDDFASEQEEFAKANRLYLAFNQLGVDYNLLLIDNTHGLYVGLWNVSSTLELWQLKTGRSENLYSKKILSPALSLEWYYFTNLNILASLQVKRFFNNRNIHYTYSFNIGMYGRFSKNSLLLF